jgi:hypothetical protein
MRQPCWRGLAKSCLISLRAESWFNHLAQGIAKLTPTCIVDEYVQPSIVLFDCVPCGLDRFDICDIEQDECDV